MSRATISSSGQITIPAPVRAAMGVQPGDHVEFVEIALGRFELIAATRPVTALKGLFAKPPKSASTKAINAAIRARATKAR